MITYTGGSFDLLHPGHLALLKACRDLAAIDGRVVVALNTDEFIEAYKGHPPVQSYAQRAEVLRACRLVDLVVCNTGGPDSGISIDVVRPDVLVIGDDWLDPGGDQRRYHAQLGVTPEWLAARDLTIVYVPRIADLSSSGSRARIEELASAGYIQPPRPTWRIENGRVVQG